MHFWISKPAGRYYSGNRYPATPMPKTLYSNHPHNRYPRLVVTATRGDYNHDTNIAGPSHARRYSVAQPLARPVNENNLPEERTPHNQLNINISNNVTNARNNQQILSNITTNGMNGSVRHFSEVEYLADALLTDYNLFRLVIACILMIGFIAITKLYFHLQGLTYDILIFCGVVMLLSVCLYSVLVRRSQVNRRRECHESQDHTISLTATNTIGNENIRPIPVARQNPPPPYHIAILSSPCNIIDESPPPSYDKIMQ